MAVRNFFPQISSVGPTPTLPKKNLEYESMGQNHCPFQIQVPTSFGVDVSPSIK